jgi:hypothetical protein
VSLLSFLVSQVLPHRYRDRLAMSIGESVELVAAFYNSRPAASVKLTT